MMVELSEVLAMIGISIATSGKAPWRKLLLLRTRTSVWQRSPSARRRIRKDPNRNFIPFPQGSVFDEDFATV